MISHLLPTYARTDIAFERGDGCWLYTSAGKPYLDFTSGVAVNILGHGHPVLIGALERQARKLWHVSNLFRVPEQETFADSLCARSFADLVFFSNSGAEAIECAVKIVRRHFAVRGMAERHRIVTFEGGFHGRTLAALSAGGRPEHLDGFDPRMPGFDQVAYGDVAGVEAAVMSATAGILVEPVQGEGGVRVAPAGFLRELRRVADEKGVLLVFDEVQCGMARTGRLFAHEWEGVYPDVAAIAKGIGGGFPLSACLSTQEAACGMVAGTHGSTYGGNPLAMSVGMAVLEHVSDAGFLSDVAEIGRYMRQGLERVAIEEPDIVEEIRGIGLMLGVKTRVPLVRFVRALFLENLLVVPSSGGVARFLPPLVVTHEEVDEALSRVSRGCARVREWMAGGS